MKLANNVKVVIDCCLLVLGLFQAITGLILYISPEGWRSGRWIFLGIYKYTWRELHTYTAFILIALVAIHVTLNWRIFVYRLKAALARKGC